MRPYARDIRSTTNIKTFLIILYFFLSLSNLARAQKTKWNLVVRPFQAWTGTSAGLHRVFFLNSDNCHFLYFCTTKSDEN